MFVIEPTRFGRIAPGSPAGVGQPSFMTVEVGQVNLAPGASSVTTFAFPSLQSRSIGQPSGAPAFGSLFVGPTSANSAGLIVANSFVSEEQVLAVELMNASESTLTQTAGLVYRVVEFAI